MITIRRKTMMMVYMAYTLGLNTSHRVVCRTHHTQCMYCVGDMNRGDCSNFDRCYKEHKPRFFDMTDINIKYGFSTVCTSFCEFINLEK